MPFNGEVARIIPGPLGITGSKTVSGIRPEHLLQAKNVSYEGGSIKKEGGSVKYNTVAISGAPAVLGGHDWWPTIGIQRMVVLLSDGTLKKDDGSGAFATTLASGLSVTNVVPVFVDGGQELATNPRKLFLFTGLQQAKVLSGDGVVANDIATPPIDWATHRPLCGEIHENRLWGAARHTVYYSLPTNHENFTGVGTGNLLVFPGVGDEIVSLLSFKGMLLVFKRPKGIYAIDTSSPDTAAWRILKINENIGIASPRAVAQIDDDVVFMTRFGTQHLLSALREFADVESSSITNPFDIDQFIRDNINKNNIQFSHMIYYQDKREVHATMSSAGAGATELNVRMVLDMNRPDVMRFRFSDKDLNRSMWLRRDASGIERVTTGDNSGFVWTLDSSVLSVGGAGYTGLFQTPQLDLGHLDPKLASINKIGKFLELIGDPSGNWFITVEVYWDAKLVQTIQFNLAVTGTPLGVFTLGTHELAGDGIGRKRKRLVGSGKYISLVGKNSSAGEGFSIAEIQISFKRGGESERAG